MQQFTGRGPMTLPGRQQRFRFLERFRSTHHSSARVTSIVA
jgi:hypothetical protein